MLTPIKAAQLSWLGTGLGSWAIAAQQHYSFLENLEKDQLDLYWFGNKEGIWNTQYEKMSLNFVGIWGRDVAREPPSKDDEQALTVDIPKKLSRRKNPDVQVCSIAH
jgi:hypothetical protein